MLKKAQESYPCVPFDNHETGTPSKDLRRVLAFVQSITNRKYFMDEALSIRNLEAGTDERSLDHLYYGKLRCDSPGVLDGSMATAMESTCRSAPASAFTGRKYATQALGYHIGIVLRVDQVVGVGEMRKIDPIVKKSYRVLS
ncbi:hypothetical protein CNMCM7691_007029 [Aspergillus felis]|uniref:Uncharacterized protein n=1 Tax=Aspergillus felis TaxID=1287682 RepID=A0A8H6QTA6_9EURO|nr:hypothetical protein CNMCM7691_007029 [Aspergillus felis]